MSVVPDRITESTSSCGSAGTTRGWSCRRTSSPTRSLSIPRCSSVCGSPTCSSPTRRAPTSTTSPRRTYSSSFSAMETSSSVWGIECHITLLEECSLYILDNIWDFNRKVWCKMEKLSFKNFAEEFFSVHRVSPSEPSNNWQHEHKLWCSGFVLVWCDFRMSFIWTSHFSDIHFLWRQKN